MNLAVSFDFFHREGNPLGINGRVPINKSLIHRPFQLENVYKIRIIWFKCIDRIIRIILEVQRIFQQIAKANKGDKTNKFAVSLQKTSFFTNNFRWCYYSADMLWVDLHSYELKPLISAHMSRFFQQIIGYDQVFSQKNW